MDLTRYIEEMSRIRKIENRQALKIALLREQVTKYVLKSLKYFKYTGLWITEYLDKNGLERRDKGKHYRNTADQYF